MSATLLDEDSVVVGRLCDQPAHALEANPDLLRYLAGRLEEVETLEARSSTPLLARAVLDPPAATNGSAAARVFDRRPKRAAELTERACGVFCRRPVLAGRPTAKSR